MIVVTLALTALLFVAIKTTRLIGIVCLALLYCLYPLLFTVILLIVGIALYILRKYHLL